MNNSQTNTSNFLKIAKQFQLGDLTTEGFNPLTKNLSYDAKINVKNALNSIKEVDLQALAILRNRVPEIFSFHQHIQDTLCSGNKVFLCGCGATGRLSLTLETLFRKKYKTDQVISFMAGGDFALIKSVESFEDKKEYGIRQLKELGFSKNDLLIGITEGGETSFVIGATEYAANYSFVKPYFVYCNPDIELKNLKRSFAVLSNPNIEKLNLTCGPMALSGSTRMQASTLQMLVTGFSLLGSFDSISELDRYLYQTLSFLEHLDYSLLEDFVISESDVYAKGELVTYKSDSDLAITILTDSTERSPTFNLKPFEQIDDDYYCECYLTIEDIESAKNAWFEMLGREPRSIDWNDISFNIGLDEIYKFDISTNSLGRRCKIHKNHIFEIDRLDNNLVFKFLDNEKTFNIDGLDDLTIHLGIKLLLNAHSTVLMGRRDRYQSNIMTWVKTSNNKLIDRAARYIIQLLNIEGIHLDYPEVIQAIFEYNQTHDPDDPLVLKIVSEFRDERQAN